MSCDAAHVSDGRLPISEAQTAETWESPKSRLASRLSPQGVSRVVRCEQRWSQPGVVVSWSVPHGHTAEITLRARAGLQIVELDNSVKADDTESLPLPLHSFCRIWLFVSAC